MTEKDFDKKIADQFDQMDFQMKESNWENMRATIRGEGAEQGVKKRGVYYRLAGAATFLLATMSVLYFYSQKKSDSKMASVASDIRTKSQQGGALEIQQIQDKALLHSNVEQSTKKGQLVKFSTVEQAENPEESQGVETLNFVENLQEAQTFSSGASMVQGTESSAPESSALDFISIAPREIEWAIEEQAMLLVEATQNALIVDESADQKQKKQRNYHFSLAALGGSSWISSKQLVSGDQDPLVWDKRLNQEHNRAAFEYGLEIAFHHKNWKLSTGLNQFEYGEEIDYSPIETEVLQVQDNSHWETVSYQDTIKLLAGGTWLILPVQRDSMSYITQIDTTSTMLTDQSITQSNGTSHISYMEIPVLLGYELQLNKVALDLEAGMSIGLRKETSHSYFDPGTSTLVSAENNLNDYSLNLLFRPGLSYALGGKLSAELKANIRYTAKPINLELQNFSQKYLSTGALLGLRYHF